MDALQYPNTISKDKGIHLSGITWKGGPESHFHYPSLSSVLLSGSLPCFSPSSASSPRAGNMGTKIILALQFQVQKGETSLSVFYPFILLLLPYFLLFFFFSLKFHNFKGQIIKSAWVTMLTLEPIICGKGHRRIIETAGLLLSCCWGGE